MDNLLKQFVNNASDAILISDKEGVISFWNCGAEQMFGHTSAEAACRQLQQMVRRSPTTGS